MSFLGYLSNIAQRHTVLVGVVGITALALVIFGVVLYRVHSQSARLVELHNQFVTASGERMALLEQALVRVHSAMVARAEVRGTEDRVEPSEKVALPVHDAEFRGEGEEVEVLQVQDESRGDGVSVELQEHVGVEDSLDTEVAPPSIEDEYLGDTDHAEHIVERTEDHYIPAVPRFMVGARFTNKQWGDSLHSIESALLADVPAADPSVLVDKLKELNAPELDSDTDLIIGSYLDSDPEPPATS